MGLECALQPVRTVPTNSYQEEDIDPKHPVDKAVQHCLLPGSDPGPGRREWPQPVHDHDDDVWSLGCGEPLQHLDLAVFTSGNRRRSVKTEFTCPLQ